MLRLDYQSKYFFNTTLGEFCLAAQSATLNFQSAFTRIEEILTQAAKESVVLDKLNLGVLPGCLSSQINVLKLESVHIVDKSEITKIQLRSNYS